MAAIPQQAWGLIQSLPMQTRSDFSSSTGDRIILQDFKNKNTTVITPANATYPYGYCEARGFSNFTNRGSRA